jgi:hypothetical protein
VVKKRPKEPEVRQGRPTPRRGGQLEALAAGGGRSDSFDYEDELGEAPTEKHTVVGEGESGPPVYPTAKLRKVEIDALLAREREQQRQKDERLASGLRPAVSDDAIERHERRARETIPAPPDEDDDTLPGPLSERDDSDSDD